jgi:hypothetical protein
MRESRVVVLVGRLCPLSLVAPRPAALMAPSGALTSRLGAPAWQEQLRHQSRWPPASDGAIIVAALACGELAHCPGSAARARHTTGLAAPPEIPRCACGELVASVVSSFRPVPHHAQQILLLEYVTTPSSTHCI